MMKTELEMLDSENCSDELKKSLELCYQKEIEDMSSCDYYIAKLVDISGQKPIQYNVKRILDVMITITILLFIWPLLLVIAMLIKLDSKGPVLFKQKRIGLLGKEFYMYKFRSMSCDAEKKLEELKQFNETNELMFKMFNDPRVTKIGKILRKYSLDELPQLINVIKGEMSLVGFRPPLPSEVKHYKGWHFVRFASKPGLTGPWQVSGRSNIKSFDKVISLEFNYAKNWNIINDFKILFKTIPVVFLGRDAA